MKLLFEINFIKEKLLKIKQVDVEAIILQTPANNEKIKQINQQINFSLPSDLVSILTKESDGISFGWSAQPDAFGESCRHGRFDLMSSQEILVAVRGLREQVEEAKRENLGDEEGYAALIKDWDFWIPIFRFASGDYFCIDTRLRKGSYPIVFLEHDVMDGGPNLHGLKIANNFEILLQKWSKIGFVDIYDWSKGVDKEGINSDLLIFQKLLKALS